MCGTGRTYADVAETIPGPSTKFLGGLAAKHHFYIVAGLYERAGKAIYNTAVLLDRDGKLTGRYHKVCIPREEVDGGIMPGTEYPVFDADFGRVGLMICWDLEFPEVARELAARGAEVILMPIWGGEDTLAPRPCHREPMLSGGQWLRLQVGDIRQEGGTAGSRCG